MWSQSYNRLPLQLYNKFSKLATRVFISVAFAQSSLYGNAEAALDYVKLPQTVWTTMLFRCNFHPLQRSPRDYSVRKITERWKANYWTGGR